VTTEPSEAFHTVTRLSGPKEEPVGVARPDEGLVTGSAGVGDSLAGRGVFEPQRARARPGDGVAVGCRQGQRVLLGGGAAVLSQGELAATHVPGQEEPLDSHGEECPVVGREGHRQRPATDEPMELVSGSGVPDDGGLVV
jgi:hypothetical protein